MHEVGIMNDILDITVEAAREAGGSKISALRIRVGELSGVVPDALSFAFDVVASSTIASGATLTVETVEATCLCTVCGDERQGTSAGSCPSCGGKSIISHGYELLVSSIEVD
jgi:hydrogenase nickel incorporation protein HypA/HybF